MHPVTREQAQQRVDDIRAFERELARLAGSGALVLSDAQQSGLSAHHAALQTEYGRLFDIDRDQHLKQLSWGMRIASFFGALALSASAFFMFYQFWVNFGTITQTLILSGATLATLALTFALDMRDRSGYFTKLAAMVAFASFVLNLAMMGHIHNITPSDTVLLVWAAMAFLLAYACDLRLLLVAGILCVDGFIAARVGAIGALYWLDVGKRPENFLPVAILVFAIPLLVPQRQANFAPIYRIFGLLTFMLPILVLSHAGWLSYLPWDEWTVTRIYQVSGFIFSAMVIALGLKRHWPDTVNTGVVFFSISLYTKFFEWWWDLFPKWAFFLVIGLASLLSLLIMTRLRRLAQSDTVVPEAT